MLVAYKGLPSPTTYLSPRNAVRSVGTALALQLWLKYGDRVIRDLESVEQLRAEPSKALDTYGAVTSEICYIGDKGARYRWARFATGGDDGDLVIKPADVAADQAGRWLKAPFRDFERRFYLKHLQLCDDRIPFRSPEDENGNAIGPSLLQLCAGKTPALFVCYAGMDTPKEVSQIPMAQDLRHIAFNLKAISGNWRGQAARYGSPDQQERTEDPGASQIIGDAEWYLRAYNDLAHTVGLGRMKIGAQRPMGGFGEDHLLCDVLPVRALVTIEVPNEPQDLIRPDVLLLQVQHVVHDVPFEARDTGEPMQVEVNRA